MMNFREYIAGVLKTESCDFNKIMGRLSAKNTVRLVHAGIGVSTEAGELLDAIKKHVFYGRYIDRVNIEEELGDLFWYIAIVCDVFGFRFDEIMEKNIFKLKKRYGDQFSAEAALNRNAKKELEHF